MNGYDKLDREEQAAVRARWTEGIKRRIAALDLACEFEARGEPYSELDEGGAIVTHPGRR